MVRLGVAVLALMFCLLPCSDGWAQPAKKGAAKAAAAKKPAIPSGPQLAIMVQTSVVALSQANLTNNYTVLHALGAPDFQKANSPDKLRKVFASIRKIDLTPVILYSPILTRQPAIDDKSMLRLTGYYKTAPEQVLFDLLFQPVEGRWRLYGISVGTRVPQPAVAAPAPSAKPAAKTKNKTKDKKK